MLATLHQALQADQRHNMLPSPSFSARLSNNPTDQSSDVRKRPLCRMRRGMRGLNLSTWRRQIMGTWCPQLIERLGVVWWRASRNNDSATDVMVSSLFAHFHLLLTARVPIGCHTLQDPLSSQQRRALINNIREFLSSTGVSTDVREIERSRMRRRRDDWSEGSGEFTGEHVHPISEPFTDERVVSCRATNLISTHALEGQGPGDSEGDGCACRLLDDVEV